MKAIAKSAKTHPAAKKCCGWQEPAICPGNNCPGEMCATSSDI